MDCIEWGVGFGRRADADGYVGCFDCGGARTGIWDYPLLGALGAATAVGAL